MKNLSRILLSAALVGGSTRALACDSCALYLAGGADRPGFTASVAEQFTRLGTVWDGANRQGNPTDQYFDSSTTQLTVGWSRGGPWQVQFTLPYITRHYRRPDHAAIEEGRVQGIGDATLAGRWQVAKLTTARGDEFECNVLGGVEFGTGDARHLGDEIGEEEHEHAEFPVSGVHGHDLALGSGSTDWLLGAYARWTHGRLFGRGALQYKLSRPGAFDYRLADETAWELGVGGYPVLTHAHSLSVQALVSGEHKGLDRLAGEAQDDTGISVRYAGARVAATWGQQLAAEASLELPVRIRASATMVVPDYRVRAAATWRF